MLCLGARAVQTLIAPDFKVSRQRGEFVSLPVADYVVATVHPSSLLRGDPNMREAAIERFVADLKKVGAALRPLDHD